MNNQLENDILTEYPLGLTWQKSIATFHPESSAEIADIFNRMRKYKQQGFISGYGNEIDPVGMTFSEMLVLKSDRLNGVIEIGDKDFYITVGSGYPLKEINKTLAEHNLWFPFGETNYPGSFGGALAVGLAGSDGTHTVPFSRYLLSVEAVLPDGSIVTPGALTFKSVSGYDVSRLFYNSWGTLGMLTTLSFRVLPLAKKDELPRIMLYSADHGSFVDELRGKSALSKMCRNIKSEFDTDSILPIV
ncbi:MAG: FAD-binding oxidoreductase [candidate division Zixibacteria bacterium]|nr:FAD-binding oxidoreductase [candidate division Zixibacteria bacterium]